MKLEKEQEEINSYISFLYHELYKILHWMYTLEKLKKFIDFKLNFNLQIDFYVILMR